MRSPIACTLIVTLLGFSTLASTLKSDPRQTAFCEGPSPSIQTTCQIGFSSDDFSLLGDPKLAFNARFKALLGYELSDQEFNARNPEMSLDFSKAPRLDEIVISTLVANNDFFGTLMFRALDHHIRQGSKVKIYVSGIFLHKREEVALKKLQDLNPDKVEVRVFYYKAKNKVSPREWFKKIHRSMHVKVFLTYSQSNPKANTLITGGRNFSDTYFYPTMPDYSKFPEMTQYGTFSYPFAYFDDLDFETHDFEVVRTVKNQIELLMESNPKNNQFQKVATNYDDVVLIPNYSDSTVAFQISAPFLDEMALEKNYVAMIDQAQSRIRVLSPYLRFTKPIFEAFERARGRGVQVQIITAANYAGDVVPFVLERSIELSLRKIMNNYEIYLYNREAGGIMHAKAVLIDEKVLALGSVNLNRRSFHHDLEVVYYLKGSKVINQFNQLFEDRYLSHSERMTELPKKRKIYDPLIYMMGNMI